MSERFKLYLLKFIFKVEAEIVLPEHKGSSIRGALLGSLRRSFCLKPKEKFCEPCVLKDTCPISFLLSHSGENSARYTYPPRPFLIKPSLDKMNEFKPDEELTFTLGFFGEDAIKFFPYVIAGARLMGKTGIGVIEKRGRMNLCRVVSVNPLKEKEQEIFEEEKELKMMPCLPIDSEDIEMRANEIKKFNKIRIKLLTPMRLVSEKKLVKNKIPFDILYRRLLERFTTLISIYEGQKFDLDFKKIIEESQKVKIEESKIYWDDVFRYSSRHKRRIPMGGYLGEIIYQGDFTNFAEILAWGEQIHVGKYAILGNGWYEMAVVA